MFGCQACLRRKLQPLAWPSPPGPSALELDTEAENPTFVPCGRPESEANLTKNVRDSQMFKSTSLVCNLFFFFKHIQIGLVHLVHVMFLACQPMSLQIGPSAWPDRAPPSARPRWRPGICTMRVPCVYMIQIWTSSIRFVQFFFFFFYQRWVSAIFFSVDRHILAGVRRCPLPGCNWEHLANGRGRRVPSRAPDSWLGKPRWDRCFLGSVAYGLQDLGRRRRSENLRHVNLDARCLPCFVRAKWLFTFFKCWFGIFVHQMKHMLIIPTAVYFPDHSSVNWKIVPSFS